MKRTPIKRKTPLRRGSTPLQRRKRINPVSKRRAKQNREYEREKKEFLQQNTTCGCCRVYRSTEVHHKRGRDNERLLKKEDWMQVCSPCHRFIEDNREWAREHGFLLDRIGKKS